MTLVETAPAPITFQRTVLVGVDDPLLTPADVLADVPAPPAPDGFSRGRLLSAVTAVVFLLVAVSAVAWWRFSDAAHMNGVSGPTPSVDLTMSGDTVTVDLGAGAPPERLDLFVDGDWVGEDHVAPYTPEWEHRSAGEHELKAKVTDVDGRVRYSDAVTVTIDG